jgi:hypothetical protein
MVNIPTPPGGQGWYLGTTVRGEVTWLPSARRTQAALSAPRYFPVTLTVTEVSAGDVTATEVTIAELAGLTLSDLRVTWGNDGGVEELALLDVRRPDGDGLCVVRFLAAESWDGGDVTLTVVATL